jgi:imidazolonepropionase-like amidohydrolase
MTSQRIAIGPCNLPRRFPSLLNQAFVWFSLVTFTIGLTSPFCGNTASAAEATTDTPVPIVVVAAHFWDGLSDTIEGSTEILIREGKISQIGKRVDHPENARFIRLPDHTVTPGFIDCHVHLTLSPENTSRIYVDSDTRKILSSLEPAKQLLMNGFTTVRDVGYVTRGHALGELKQLIDRGTIVGPRIIVASHVISSTAGHGDAANLMSEEFERYSFGVADGSDAIRKRVREEIRGGAEWIKFAATGGFSSPSDDPANVTYTQEEMDVLVATAKQLNIPVTVHAYGDQAVQMALKAGVRSVEHANLASVETLKLMEQQNIFLIPTQYDLLSNALNIDNDEYWKSASVFKRKKYVRYSADLLKTAGNLAKSEVKIVFGTDAGMFPHRENWREFPMLVRNGISPIRALRAATSTAAEMLQRDDLGVLAVGKAADLVAMPGNPLQDIDVTGRVDFVMKQGTVYKSPNNLKPE